MTPPASPARRIPLYRQPHPLRADANPTMSPSRFASPDRGAPDRSCRAPSPSASDPSRLRRRFSRPGGSPLPARRPEGCSAGELPQPPFTPRRPLPRRAAAVTALPRDRGRGRGREGRRRRRGSSASRGKRRGRSSATPRRRDVW